MRYQEQQKLQKHQKAEIAEHCLKEIDLKIVTGEAFALVSISTGIYNTHIQLYMHT